MDEDQSMIPVLVSVSNKMKKDWNCHKKLVKRYVAASFFGRENVIDFQKGSITLPSK